LARATLVGLILLTGGFALGQTPPLPGTLQPGRVDRDTQPAKPEPGTSAVPIALPATPGTAVPANADATRFKLASLEVAGVTVFSETELSTFWASSLGQEVSLRDVYAIAAAITEHYQRAGYLLCVALVPAQQISGGQVRLQVVEGYIDVVHVQNGAGQLQDDIAARLSAHLIGQRPLKLATLERALLILNDQPGTTARAYLRRSTQDGASMLDVVVQQTSLSGSVAIDNHGTRYLGIGRYSLSVAENGELGARERNELDVQGSLDGHLAVGSYEGLLPLGSDGLIANVNYVQSFARPQAYSGPPGLTLQSESAGIGLSYPIIRSRQTDLVARITLAGEDSGSYALGEHLAQDDVRPFRVGLAWNLSDGSGGLDLVDAELSRGIGGLGASPNQSPLFTRIDSDVTFTKFTLYAARLQPITADYSLLVAINSQYSDDRLVPIEELGLGGEQFLRGFDASELLGDKGFALKLELRRNFNVEQFLVTGYVFFDHGQVWSNNLGGGTTRELASSAGVGLRFGPYRSLTGYVEWDQPLARDVASLGNRSPRLFAGVAAAF
jgi:hemolysin activation/secretion protein